MLEVTATVRRVKIDTNHISVQAGRLADDLARLMTGRVQTTLLQYRKKVSGDTLASVGWHVIQNSLLRQRRHVTAGWGFKFIVSGRKPGKPMPVRLVGEGPRGGKIFEPQPKMLQWFRMKGIDRSLWWPIMRSIARNGIQPLDIPHLALRNSRSEINALCRLAGVRIAHGILRPV